MVSGLLPQDALEYSVAVTAPMASTFRVTLSGALVTGAATGSSNQNQNSVALNTLRSWHVHTPMPTWRPSARISAWRLRQPA